MNTIETAEDRLLYFRQLEEWDIPINALSDLMIDFAKLHVQEALKQASENAEADSPYASVVKDSILTAYDLNNIK